MLKEMVTGWERYWPSWPYYVVKFGGALVGSIILLPHMSVLTYLGIGIIYCSVAHILWTKWIKQTYSMSMDEWMLRSVILQSKEPQKFVATIEQADVKTVIWILRIWFGILGPICGACIWPGELLHDFLGEIFPKLKHPYFRGKHPDFFVEEI